MVRVMLGFQTCTFPLDFDGIEYSTVSSSVYTQTKMANETKRALFIDNDDLNRLVQHLFLLVTVAISCFTLLISHGLR